MTLDLRASFVLALVLAPLCVQPAAATQPPLRPASAHRAHVLRPVAAVPASPPPAAVEAVAPPATRPGDPIAEVTLGDIGFVNGVRFANLGGHRELYVPLPQGGEVAARELVLVLDDFSAHDARRNLEVQVNDRTVAAIVLDGKGRGRVVRVPLGNVRPKDGYLKLAFLYSGAATLDRCIDVRYVGDSLTIRPRTAVALDVGPLNSLDVATTAALLPRDVAIVLPGRRIADTEIASAITVARALIASGRRVAFYHGYDRLHEIAQRDDDGRWVRGVVLVGPLADALGVIDAPVARLAGDPGQFGTLEVVRIKGLPALLIADGEIVRAGRLFGSPLLAATRGVAAASIGSMSPIERPTERATFDELGVPPAQAEVFGRAELNAVIDTRRLPAGTRPTRLMLDVNVAPDGAGEKAVVSAFVNEHLLGSMVAATGEATRLDLPLPDGLLGVIANVRVVVQRDSAQGDCRFEPQGYPAQILGSSALILAPASAATHDFSDLAPYFARRLEILLPQDAAEHPTHTLGMVAEVVDQLSPDTAPLDVKLVDGGAAPAPDAPFVAVGDVPPANAIPRVRFDRGRVDVADRAGQKLLDLGGFAGGAVVQLITAGDNPGLWIKPMSPGGIAPEPAELHLDHGDVAFVDAQGVALAMSTERDAVVRISYPDQVSWLTIAGRFRFWIIAGVWLFATAVLLLALQRMFRRRPANPVD